jgi:hypothetical protein
MRDAGKIETEVGVLRVEVDGAWTASSFAGLLTDLAANYDRLNTVDFFARAARSVDYRIAALWDDSYVRRHSSTRGADANVAISLPSFGVLVSIARRFTDDLSIGSVSYASPGWVEVIGSWNPLKVIADAFNQSKHLTNERRRIELEAKNQRLKQVLEARTAELAIRADVWKEVLRIAPPYGGANASDRLVQLNAEVIEPAEEFVERLAADGRIGALTLAPLSDDPSPAVQRASTRARRRAGRQEEAGLDAVPGEEGTLEDESGPKTTRVKASRTKRARSR